MNKIRWLEVLAYSRLLRKYAGGVNQVEIVEARVVNTDRLCIFHRLLLNRLVAGTGAKCQLSLFSFLDIT